MNKPGIYKIINTVNNHLYIGSSNNLKRRKCQHFSRLKSGTHANKHLQSAYNKYGLNSFVFEIIEIVEGDLNGLTCKLLKQEQYWIDTLRPEYNILHIAGRPIGYHHTIEARQSISNTLKGKKKTEEHALHIRQGQKGRTLTSEHRQKLSQAAKTRKVQGHCTRVEIDGVIYNSQKEAATCLKLHVTTIQRRLKNENYPQYKLIK